MNRLASLIIFASFAATASASQLSLRFVGQDVFDDSNAGTCYVCGLIQVEVLWTQNASEASNGLGGVSFFLTAAPEDPAAGLQGERLADPYLTLSNFSTPLPGWTVSGTPGVLGASSNFAVGANLSSAALTTSGTTVIGTFDIDLLTPGVLVHEFYIQRSSVEFTPVVTTSFGTPYFFSASNPNGYQGNYDIGNGYAGNADGSGALPMTVYDLVPEPATSVLWAFASMALLSRKRRT